MKNKSENGEVVVEASIVVTIVVIFISVMLYIGMILYQQSLVSMMANQTASNIAQVYSNSLRDPFTGYVDVDKVYQSVTYSNLKDDAYMDVIKQKADVFSKYRLKSSRMLANESLSVDVQIVKKPNELLKNQIVVTIRDKYDIPFVGFFGTDGLVEFGASGRADCVDILEYINGVEAISDPENSNPTPVFEDTCIIQFVPNRDDGRVSYTVPVIKGKSIYTSREYTNSSMPTTPHSDKFEFVEWVKADGSSFTASTAVSGNTTVYGKWHCTVTFKPEGGNVSPTSKKVVVGSQAVLPTPTRSGYAFEGWFTQKNGAGSQYWSNGTVFNDNVTLYAHWRCTHNYVLKNSTAGTCVAQGTNYYKCDRCGHEKQEAGNYGGHNYQYAGISGYWCYERSYVYRCSHCGGSYTTPCSGGEHNFSGQCTAYHGCTAGKFKCSTNNPPFQPGACQATRMYHITCEYCGTIQTKSTWYGGKLVTSQTYWCGTHGGSSKKTGCGHSGSKK